MKKLFVIALAAMGMVACVQNEIVEVVKSDVIAFDGSHVDNATRAEIDGAEDPSTTINTIQGFNVWGFMNGNGGTVFTGNDVTRNGDSWVYDDIQYWMPKNKYYFAGVSPIGGKWTATNGDTNNLYPVDIIDFENVDGTEDLLYAYSGMIETQDDVKNMGEVDMVFNHLLSKVKFTFQNGFATKTVKVDVQNVKMVAPKMASVNVAGDKFAWDTPSTETVTLEFGATEQIDGGVSDAHEAAAERLTIPTDNTYEYEVSFDVVVYQGEEEAFTVTKTSTITGIALEQGKAYNLTAVITPENLDLKPIEFSVSVEGWVNAATPDASVSETELLGDIQLSNHVVMSGDVTLTNTPLVISKDLVLDLGGYTLTGAIEVADGVNVTVMNGEIINNNGSYNAIGSWGNLTLKDLNVISERHAVRIEAGSAVIDGGTYKTYTTISASTTRALNVGNEGTPTTVVIKDGNFVGAKGAPKNGGGGVIAVKKDATVIFENGSAFDSVWKPETNTITNSGTLIISGGTFEQDPSAWLADGYDVVYKKDLVLNRDGYVVVPQIVADLSGVTTETTVTMTEDVTVATGTTIHTQDATAPITIEGNGNSIVSTAESADDFQWEGGMIPAMSTVLSSADGSKVTVNNVNFEGTMSALMLGNYKNATYNNYNTELNNVNVIDTKVVSFSSNVAPAVCVYGTAVLNNCNIYGTTRSELEDSPMWPVYDVAAVNYSTTTLNDTKVGSMIFWNQAALIVNSGSVIDELVLLGNMNNGNAKNYININAGAEVKVIDLSNITDKTRVKINVEAGATVGKVVANGIEYPSVAAYTGSTEVADSAGLENALQSGAETVVVAAGTYGTLPAIANSDVVVTCAEGTVFEGQSSLDIDGATVIGATFKNEDGIAVRGTINGTLKNCTFTGTNGGRWCYAGETVVFEDCVFDGSVYGVHFDGGANDVIFRNCTISGFNALGGALTMVTFEGCTFVGNGKSGYNGANLWGSAKLIDCEFTFDGSTSTEWIDCIGADKTYEFENCTVNGVAYTPANYTDYEDIFSRNNVVVKINGVDCQM